MTGARGTPRIASQPCGWRPPDITAICPVDGKCGKDVKYFGGKIFRTGDNKVRGGGGGYAAISRGMFAGGGVPLHGCCHMCYFFRLLEYV